jgi:transcriptional regulator GlxA family with amidase domain
LPGSGPWLEGGDSADDERLYGSLVFAAAGVPRGRPATTHWASLGLLGETDPSIEIRRDDRYVDDGDVVTSAGVSAGIDMALHLVSRLAGSQRAA